VQRLAAAWRAGEPPGSPRPSGGTGSGTSTRSPTGGPLSQPGGPPRPAARRAARDYTIRELAAAGAGLVEIAQAVGVSTATARRALSSDR